MQSGGQQSDQTSNLFWMIILVVILGGLAWWAWHSYIVQYIFDIKRVEYIAAVGFQDLYFLLVKYLHFPLPPMYHNLEQWSYFMATTSPSNVTMAQVGELSHDIGIWFTVPSSIILCGLAYYLYFHDASSRFIKEYSMKSLQSCAMKEWPQITPITQQDLASAPLDEGPWAMAQLPIFFAKKHGFIMVGKDKEGKKRWLIDRVKAHRQFVLQVGSLYKGVEALPIHLKAIVVILVLRAMHKRPEANKFIFQIAASASSGQLNFSGVEEKIQAIKQESIIAFLDSKHAYITTWMATLLELARTEGVMASAEILWLKPLDRRMWYVMNTVGRQVPFVESAGPFAHWLAEKKLNRPLRIPMVDMAVNGLELALNDVLYIEEANQWRFKGV
jgi:intracellular multiplication protein IcmP